ncbi:hypothetical protein [Delftia tsuruhatensis]|uniref:hypothetical protein n=1 Tax=Delftia tsuruhatensis TaxID=180282 RepID=UPI002AD20382|nr:hypothetical protein [Delftia tsuruhatensis]WQM86043.1 hypothetical protein RNT40_14660 [Delftia tsuruhatensis]
MSLDELAHAIQKRYLFIKKPSIKEIEDILNKISENEKSGNKINEYKLDEIVYECVKNRLALSLSSIDMGNSISLLKQIMKAAQEHSLKNKNSTPLPNRK